MQRERQRERDRDEDIGDKVRNAKSQKTIFLGWEAQTTATNNINANNKNDEDPT